MLCGTQALLGLHLHFYSTPDQRVWARARGTIHQQGYQGILHGGFLSALLDSGMCQALFQQDIEAVTADMSIRYLHEVPVDSQILIQGKIVSSRAPLYKVEGELYVQGKLMVKSTARFMKKGFGVKKSLA
jgi:acyl-coenzyme A thioesterase PaaI-like protein